MQFDDDMEYQTSKSITSKSIKKGVERDGW
jgi:hypothetical protein